MVLYQYTGNVPVSEHAMETLVLEADIKLWVYVSLWQQHLQTHAPEHSVEVRQQEQQLLHEPDRRRRSTVMHVGLLEGQHLFFWPPLTWM